jgi:hypothetical protein
LAVIASPSWAAVIGNQNIINLVKVGIDEHDILTIISANETAFSLTDPDVKKLKRAGVSERILQAMTRKQQATSPVNRDEPPLHTTQERTDVAREKPPTVSQSPPPQKAGRVTPPEPVENVDDDERRLMEEFEEEQSSKPAVTEVTEDSELTDEERRLIEELEASELEDEEKRLIEEYEKKHSKKPVK